MRDREKLALKIFAVLLAANALFWWAFSPTPPPSPIRATSELVEVRVHGTLLTPFAAGKRVLLSSGGGMAWGPAQLVAQEEGAVVLALTPELYRRHHVPLAREEWVLLPYLDGMAGARRTNPGRNYEIAY